MNLTPWQHPKGALKEITSDEVKQCSTGIIGTLLSSQRTHAHPRSTLSRPATGASFHRTALVFKLFPGVEFRLIRPAKDWKNLAPF
jgi:hypothetical protein